MQRASLAICAGVGAGQLSPYRQIAKQLSSALHLYINMYTFILKI
jgi:hypothetical protein